MIALAIVADQSLGIPPEEREKIFEPFYQMDKHRTGNIEGFGLGLALVKAIMDASGGRVAVESEVGKGTTFRLALPAGK